MLAKDIPDYKSAVKRLKTYCPSKFTVNKIFIIDCDSSLLLPRFALEGWEISGICKSEEWINSVKEFCHTENCTYGDLIVGDFKTFDCATLTNRYTILVSTGILLHHPSEFLKRWLITLKPGGTVFTGIPNCESVNGWIHAKISPSTWSALNPIDGEMLDQIHRSFGLKPIRTAYYSRGVDVHMLIPWNKLKLMFKSPFLYKSIKTIAVMIQRVISPFVKDGNRKLNSFIYAIYSKG